MHALEAAFGLDGAIAFATALVLITFDLLMPPTGRREVFRAAGMSRERDVGWVGLHDFGRV